MTLFYFYRKYMIVKKSYSLELIIYIYIYKNIWLDDRLNKFYISVFKLKFILKKVKKEGCIYY